MKYLILGNGYLGNRLAEALEDSLVHKGKVKTPSEIYRAIKKHKPLVIINAAGKTGKPNVDWCESHKEETHFANVTLPLMIAEQCKTHGVKMIHLGSGCVYQGDNSGKGFSETDPANFFGSFYSRTKSMSEEILKEHDVLQLRIRMPLDSKPAPRNLIDKLVKYDKIVQIENSITVIPDFIYTLKELVERNQTGVFNVVNEGAITHGEILDIYSRVTGKIPRYERINEEELSKLTIAGRSNCVLSTSKLRSLDITLRDTRESLEECFREYAKQ